MRGHRTAVTAWLRLGGTSGGPCSRPCSSRPRWSRLPRAPLLGPLLPWVLRLRPAPLQHPPPALGLERAALLQPTPSHSHFYAVVFLYKGLSVNIQLLCRAELIEALMGRSAAGHHWLSETQACCLVLRPVVPALVAGRWDMSRRPLRSRTPPLPPNLEPWRLNQLWRIPLIRP